MVKVFLLSFQHTFHTYSVEHFVKCGKYASMTFVDGNVSVILRKFLNFSRNKISRSVVFLCFIFSVENVHFL